MVIVAKFHDALRYLAVLYAGPIIISKNPSGIEMRIRPDNNISWRLNYSTNGTCVETTDPWSQDLIKLASLGKTPINNILRLSDFDEKREIHQQVTFRLSLFALVNEVLDYCNTPLHVYFLKPSWLVVAQPSTEQHCAYAMLRNETYDATQKWCQLFAQAADIAKINSQKLVTVPE